MSDTIDQIDETGWSEDYALLWDLIPHQSVVCLMGQASYTTTHGKTPRHLASTVFRNGMYVFSVTGIDYVYSDKARFIMACEHFNVRFFLPLAEVHKDKVRIAELKARLDEAAALIKEFSTTKDANHTKPE